jgi:hypothetical protein
MASPPGPPRPIRICLPSRSWSRRELAWSGGLHALLFALAGWATRGGYTGALPPAPEQVTRAYALHYLIPVPPLPRPQPRTQHQQVSRPAPVAPVRPLATTPSTAPIPSPETRTKPRGPAMRIEALAPGAVSGIGQIIPTPGSDATPGRGLAGMLGFRGPAAGKAGTPRRGPDRVAELVDGVGSACPALRRPAGGPQGQVAIAVAFVVDTNGTVDRQTLRVTESPHGPPGEKQFHSHIYVVGATALTDGDPVEPAPSDSVLTLQVTSHVAGLRFRPALSLGQVIRSTVLVSCQVS